MLRASHCSGFDFTFSPTNREYFGALHLADPLEGLGAKQGGMDFIQTTNLHACLDWVAVKELKSSYANMGI